jgi:hypothetical protein
MKAALRSLPYLLRVVATWGVLQSVVGVAPCMAQAETETKTTKAAAAAAAAPASSAARTAPGDYQGDCFRLYSAPEHLEAGKTYMVLSQNKREGDPTLVLQEAKPNHWWFGCEPRLKVGGTDNTSKETVSVLASELVGLGAVRTGWTYGVLALPYKYHPHDKSFTSNVSVGPYLGRRIDAWGQAMTIAVSAGLGSVTGEQTAADGTKSSPTLAAFTFAGGFMLDVSKGAKPFKAGVFVGRDVVSADSATTYRHNRKNWFALQLGFDFTDN